jgi:hypothetical protein
MHFRACVAGIAGSRVNRRQKIEQALSDWFRRNTDFSVSEGVAEVWIGGHDGFGSQRSVTVDLSRLADDLDNQFERIGATK